MSLHSSSESRIDRRHRGRRSVMPCSVQRATLTLLASCAVRRWRCSTGGERREFLAFLRDLATDLATLRLHLLPSAGFEVGSLEGGTMDRFPVTRSQAAQINKSLFPKLNYMFR